MKGYGTVKTRYFEFAESGVLTYYEDEIAANTGKAEKGYILIDENTILERKDAKDTTTLNIISSKDKLSCRFSRKNNKEIIEMETWNTSIKNFIEKKQNMLNSHIESHSRATLTHPTLHSQEKTLHSQEEKPEIVSSSSTRDSVNVSKSFADSNASRNENVNSSVSFKPTGNSSMQEESKSVGSPTSSNTSSISFVQESKNASLSTASNVSRTSTVSMTESKHIQPSVSVNVSSNSSQMRKSEFIDSTTSRRTSEKPSSMLERHSVSTLPNRMSESPPPMISRKSSSRFFNDSTKNFASSAGLSETGDEFTGYLTKWPMKSSFGGEKRRFFVLHLKKKPVELEYYENENNYEEKHKPKGSITITLDTSIKGTNKIGSKAPTFSIESGNDNVLLRGDDRQEDEAWIKILKSTVESLSEECETVPQAHRPHRTSLHSIVFFNALDSNIGHIFKLMSNSKQLEFFSKKDGINITKIRLVGLPKELDSYRTMPGLNRETVEFIEEDFTNKHYKRNSDCFVCDTAILSLPPSNMLLPNENRYLNHQERLSTLKNIIQGILDSGFIKHIIFLSFCSAICDNSHQNIYSRAENAIKLILGYSSVDTNDKPKLSILRYPLQWDRLINFHTASIMNDGALYNYIPETQKFYVGQLSDIIQAAVKVIVYNPFETHDNKTEYHDLISKSCCYSYQEVISNILEYCPYVMQNAKYLQRKVPLEYVQLPLNVLKSTALETKATGNMDVDIFFSAFSEEILESVNDNENGLSVLLNGKLSPKNHWLIKHPSIFKMRSVLIFGGTGLIGRSVVQRLSEKHRGQIKIHVLTRDSTTSQSKVLSVLPGVRLIDYCHSERMYNPHLEEILKEDDSEEEDDDVTQLLMNLEKEGDQFDYKESRVLKAVLKHKRYDALLCIPPLHPEMADITEWIAETYKSNPNRLAILVSSPVASTSYQPKNILSAHASIFQKLEMGFSRATSTSRTAKNGIIIRVPLLLETLLLPLSNNGIRLTEPTLLILPLLSTPTCATTLFTPVTLLDVAAGITSVVNDCRKVISRGVTTIHFYQPKVTASEIALTLSQSIDNYLKDLNTGDGSLETEEYWTAFMNMMRNSGQYRNCISLLSLNGEQATKGSNPENESIERLRPTMLSILPEELTPFQAKYILDLFYLIEEGYEPLSNGSSADLSSYLLGPFTNIKDWANTYSPMILELIVSRLQQTGGLDKIGLDYESNVSGIQELSKKRTDNKRAKEEQEKTLHTGNTGQVSFA